MIFCVDHFAEDNHLCDHFLFGNHIRRQVYQWRVEMKRLEIDLEHFLQLQSIITILAFPFHWVPITAG